MEKIVVLIDDDSDDLYFVGSALDKIDPAIQYISFLDPEEAIKVLKEKKVSPDYIFIDVNMPKISGYECLHELRNISALNDTPIIMYSTSMPASVANVLLERGATYALEKPRFVQEYISMLESVLNHQPVLKVL